MDRRARGERRSANGTAEFSDEQRRLLPVLLIPGFMSLLAVSSVNVILPSLARSLDAGPNGLQWVISGYALTFGVLLVAAGRAGDVFGRGKLFVLGLAVFGAGSVASGIAPDILLLNLARVLMGIGSGLLSPQITGLIQQYYRGVQRGRAFGAFGGVVGVSVAIGPLMAGSLIALFGPEWGWRASFLINAPIAVLAILAARKVLPASAWAGLPQGDPSSTQPVRVQTPGAEPKHPRADFDPVGMVLLTLAILLIMVPFVESGMGAWIWSSLVLGVVLVPVWVQWERRYVARGRSPMVDMQLFRTRSFRNGTLLISLYFLGYTSIWILVAQYMQEGVHHSAFLAGLIGLPAALAGAVTAPLAGRHVLAVGRRMVLWGIGLNLIGLLSSALVVYLRESTGFSEWWLLLTLTITGVGQGLVVSPNQTLTLHDVPVRYAGSAGGILQTGQRIGTSIGIAMITGVAFSIVATANWSAAFVWGFLVVSVIVALAGGVGAIDLIQGRRARRRGGEGI